jgi:hypothetical protein
MFEVGVPCGKGPSPLGYLGWGGWKGGREVGGLPFTTADQGIRWHGRRTEKRAEMQALAQSLRMSIVNV